MTEETRGSGFGWFLAGLGVGMALGLLYAPKSGSEMREDLAEQARESGEYLKRKSRVAAEQLNTLVDSGRERVGDYVERGRQVVERGRAQLDTYVDRGRQAVAQNVEKVAAAVDAGKQAYKSTTTGENSI